MFGRFKIDFKLLFNKGLNKIKSKKEKKVTDFKPYRKEVSKLIIFVLTNKLIVREALLRFPPDIMDESIQSAWHALCHREADEDLRRRDPLYKEEQDDFLEMIAFTLQKGDELPKNIINGYKKYHSDALIPHSKKRSGIIASLMRYLNIF